MASPDIPCACSESRHGRVTGWSIGYAWDRWRSGALNEERAMKRRIAGMGSAAAGVICLGLGFAFIGAAHGPAGANGPGSHLRIRPHVSQAAARELGHRRDRRHGGRSAGSHLRRAAAGHAAKQRAVHGRGRHAAQGRLLYSGAAGARVRPGGHARAFVGRPRRRVTTGRRSSTASSSIRRTRCGSPAAATRTRSC